MATKILSKSKCRPLKTPLRNLNLQEYHSKNLLQSFGLNTQKFYIANNSIDAERFATKLINEDGAPEIVLKAQILAGGRGAGTFTNGFKGGVKLSTDPIKIGDLAGKMLGQRLVTKQTPADGVLVNTVMVAHALNIDTELYLAILLDRDHNGPVIVASPAGGMDIEKVAEETPELIYKLPVDITDGIQDKDALDLAAKLGLSENLVRPTADQIIKLYNLFIKVDATQVEINPLGITDNNEVVCFDAKVNFDDCAEFSQQEIFKLGDNSESNPREIEAEEAGLNFISLDGNIACVVNGAGLAMATMDLVKFNGGEPANFLDLGGGVNKAGVLTAFGIILKDPNVKSILVNIFGGIVDCATVAQGIVDACKELHIKIPLAVRLEGNNADVAAQIIRDSGLDIIAEQDFDKVSKEAVRLAN